MDYLNSLLNSLPPASALTSPILNEYLDSIRQQRGTILEASPDILLLLSPARNSIGCLAVLHVLLDDAQPLHATVQPYLLDAILDFILNFDPRQIRHVGHAFVKLLGLFGAGQLFSPLVAVELLATAILRLDPSGSVFTSTHLTLVKLAYETGCLEPALRVINQDITSYPGLGISSSRPLYDADIPPSVYISTTTGLTLPINTVAVLEYNLQCGLIHISRRDWPKAVDALERVITHPTKERGVSKIMTEAYKKWVLVGLLAQGTMQSLPSYTSPSAKTVFSNLAEPYLSVAALFKGDSALLKSEAEKHSIIWAEDANLSLIAEVLSAHQKWAILNLQETHQRISISHIQQTTASAESGEPLGSTQEVVELLKNMMESHMLKGEIQATDEDDQTYLKFQDDTSSLTEQDFARELTCVQRNIEALGKDFKEANERLSGNREYVKHFVRDQRRSDKAVHEEDAQILDEDLMTGLADD